MQQASVRDRINHNVKTAAKGALISFSQMNLKYRINKTRCFLMKSPRRVGEMSKNNRRNNQDKLIKASITNSVNNSISISGNVSSLFLLTLGATPMHIGIMATLNQSFPFVKILGLKILPFLGRSRLCAWGRLLAFFPLLGLIMIAMSNRGGVNMVILAIALYAIRGFFVTCGNTSWQPLVQDSILQKETGVFLARMRIKLRAVDVVFPIMLGLYIGKNPTIFRFTPMFILAAAVTLAGSYFFACMVETPLQKEEKPLFSRIMHVLGKKPVQRYGIFSSCHSLVSTASVPLWVVFLKSCNMPASQIVWLGTVSALGSIIGIGRWGQESDRRGSRRVISLTMIPLAALSVFWILAPSGGKALFIWAFSLYIIHGFLGGGLELAKTRAMVQAVPEDCQAEGFVMSFYLQAIGGAVGGFLGGLAYNGLSQHGGTFMGLDQRQVYLAALQFLRLPVWMLSRGIADRYLLEEKGRGPMTSLNAEGPANVAA